VNLVADLGGSKELSNPANPKGRICKNIGEGNDGAFNMVLFCYLQLEEVLKMKLTTTLAKIRACSPCGIKPKSDGSYVVISSWLLF